MFDLIILAVSSLRRSSHFPCSFDMLMHKIQEQQCTTVNEQQCNTVTETTYESECTTIQEQKCEIQYMTQYEQQCTTQNENVSLF